MQTSVREQSAAGCCNAPATVAACPQAMLVLARRCGLREPSVSTNAAVVRSRLLAKAAPASKNALPCKLSFTEYSGRARILYLACKCHSTAYFSGLPASFLSLALSTSQALYPHLWDPLNDRLTTYDMDKQLHSWHTCAQALRACAMKQDHYTSGVSKPKQIQGVLVEEVDGQHEERHMAC